MKTKNVITATLLSAGLILGTTSAAYAVDPTPGANLTVVSYSSQFVTFNLTSVAFDAATATFRTEMSADTGALAAYKVSYATLQQTYQAALKANTPTTTAIRYGNLMAAYKVASSAYHSSARLFRTESNTYQGAVQSYEKSYRTAMQSYKVTRGMYEQINATIYTNFETAVNKANSAFAVSLKASKTKAQKASAIKIRHKAVVAAIAIRSAARVALGTMPIMPVQQIQIDQKVDNFAAVRLARPLMSI